MLRIFLALAAVLFCRATAFAQKRNVLFVAFDDLKPLMGCYGDPMVKTPNFDRLAARGTLFQRAYCQQAVCGPSRASLLTGMRPDTTKVYDLKTRFRSILPEVVTLPQHFKANGYEAVGMGKIYDPRSVEGRVKDDPASWSRYLHAEKSGGVQGFLNPEFVKRARALTKEKGLRPGNADELKDALGGMPPTECEDVPDNAYHDGEIADLAVATLKELAAAANPFFLAVGFSKPHLPFVAPKRYWDLYQREAMPLAKFTTLPVGAPQIAFQDSWELKNGSYDRKLVPAGPGLLPEPLQRQLIHGYMACISYVDAQLGRVLDALDASPAGKNTIIVIWGDHGWHLGDHGMWCKHTNYEEATRVPLMIAHPGGKSARCASPVEFVDIYPTLCELAGLPLPAKLQGTSLLPVLKDPSAKVKDFAVSQYPRGNGDKEVMGYALRDTRYRYVRWVKAGETAPVEEELHDYESDPGETKSLARDSAAQPVLETMRTRFQSLQSRATSP